MKTAEKIHLYSQLIQHIDYDNREGGKYAYVQYLSYVREILKLLAMVPALNKESAYFEQTSAKFNDYLCDLFSEQQRTFFHQSRMQTLLLLQEIKIYIEGELEEDTLWFRKAG